MRKSYRDLIIVVVLTGAGLHAGAQNQLPPIAPVPQNPPTQAPAVLPPLSNSQTPFAGPPTKPGTGAPAVLPHCPPGADTTKCTVMVPPQKTKPKEDAMSKIGPILNALGSAMGGGGGGGYEPADSTERMAAPWDSGANGGSGGYSPAASTTYAKNLSASSGRGTAAIVEPFKQWFDVCTEKVGVGTCSFRNDGIWGDAAHMRRKSCHNVGAAIDVGLPFKCTSGGVIEATDQRAMEVAKCMAAQTNGTFGVIFRNEVQAPGMSRSSIDPHKNHMHIKLRSCPW